MHRLEDHPAVASDHAVRAKAIENRMEQVYREAIAELLFGQLPVPVDRLDDGAASRMLDARNAHGEPVAMRYHRVSWLPLINSLI